MDKYLARITGRLSVLSTVVFLVACNSVPTTNIRQPLSARPQPAMPVSQADGAIFQAGNSTRMLFEDRRARYVGDTLTILIAEATNTADTSASSSSQAGSFSVSTPTLSGGPANSTLLGPLTVSNASNGTAASRGATSGTNIFNGTLSATVVEVLPNGNLVVSGEKLVSINRNDQYVRIAGVVNPMNVTSNNTVLSTQVADVQLEYKGASNIDKSAVLSMLQRAFMSIMPFN